MKKVTIFINGKNVDAILFAKYTTAKKHAEKINKEILFSKSGQYYVG